MPPCKSLRWVFPVFPKPERPESLQGNPTGRQSDGPRKSHFVMILFSADYLLGTLLRPIQLLPNMILTRLSWDEYHNHPHFTYVKKEAPRMPKGGGDLPKITHWVRVRRGWGAGQDLIKEISLWPVGPAHAEGHSDVPLVWTVHKGWPLPAHRTLPPFPKCSRNSNQRSYLLLPLSSTWPYASQGQGLCLFGSLLNPQAPGVT